MKKILVLVLALVMSATLFAGCTPDGEEIIFQETEIEGVVVNLSNITSTSAYLIIKDTNGTAHTYGEYKIEKNVDGNWVEAYKLNENMNYVSSGSNTPTSGEVRMVITWNGIYGELPAGNYRLLKKVDSEFITIEFTIE